jgi:hypothetical protein
MCPYKHNSVGRDIALNMQRQGLNLVLPLFTLKGEILVIRLLEKEKKKK